jgi:hypothetical protein
VSEDLIEEMIHFVREQLDEDERKARAATPGAWRVTTRSSQPYAEDGEIHTVAVHARYVNDKTPEPYRVVTHGDFHEAVDRADAEHIARHDPARVLRDVRAYRKIIAEYEAEIARGPARPKGLETQSEARHGGILDAYRAALLILAAIFADRPGYREEWRP